MTTTTFNPSSTDRDGTIQTFTVPRTGKYRIRCWGAQGGGGVYGYGGYGAYRYGEMDLTAGEVLKIIVGHGGRRGAGGGYEGGGGGGSFVYRGTDELLCAAGGGGGSSNSGQGNSGQITTSGTQGGSAALTWSHGTAGTNGSGGSGGYSASGAGWLGTGGTASWSPTGSVRPGSACAPGRTYDTVVSPNGQAYGGRGDTTNLPNGGWGGGAGAHGNSYIGGGGGGGYSGGAGAASGYGGGGGGSFVHATMVNVGGTAGQRGSTTLPGVGAYSMSGLVELTELNTAPVVSNLAPSGVINPRVDTTFTWTYSDAEGTAQTQYELSYRRKGTTDAYTTASGTTAQSHTVAANTFAVGEWEVRVRAFDGTAWSSYVTVYITVASNKTRLRPLFLNGAMQAEIAIGATTLENAEFASLPVVRGTQELMVVLDPGAVFGAPEVVRCIEHASASSTIDVVRGMEGTTARAHPAQTRWAVAPLPSDLGQAHVPDTRNDLELPSDYVQPLVRSDFKIAANLGLPSGYCQLESRVLWSDDSGGGVWQFAYHQNGKVYRRYGTRGSGWGAWSETGGASAGLVLIEKITPAAVASNVFGNLRFSNIPTWAKRLVVRGRGLRTLGTNAGSSLYLRFNNNSEVVYAGWTQYHTTGGWTGTTIAAQGQGFAAHSYFYVGGGYGDSDLDIDISRVGSHQTTWSARHETFMNATAAQYPYGSEVRGTWFRTAAITQIDLWTSAAATWEAKGEIALYGSVDV